MVVADLVSPTSYYQSFKDYRRFNQEFQMKEESKEVLTEKEMGANFEQVVQSEKIEHKKMPNIK
ncbi:hypothetical protein JMM81_08350 [Bacillus sp. V3B]|uniref:hypothetical protein n=1 Tax=Bacillus sp. V3B TaxID=2804915 RepID=UPI00210D9694|nr:hypothetical protein [Bacillus sp. V3B]MCQ6274970.1 hypothetical protein [Bacillus sp. V3B]